MQRETYHRPAVGESREKLDFATESQLSEIPFLQELLLGFWRTARQGRRMCPDQRRRRKIIVACSISSHWTPYPTQWFLPRIP